MDISSREYSSFFILDTFLRESVATEAFVLSCLSSANVELVFPWDIDRSQPEAIFLQQKILYTLTKSMEYTVIANSPWHYLTYCSTNISIFFLFSSELTLNPPEGIVAGELNVTAVLQLKKRWGFDFIL